ncbi:hypothetical protein ACET3Z_025544 [Daucus carota]
MSKFSLALALAALLFFKSYCFGALQYGFYDAKCGSSDVENIVTGVVNSWCNIDPTRSAALLRMQFHDCFVKGCDASILLSGSDSERTAFPNSGVRGFDVIDEAKAAVEAVCPGVVSCADIIVMATRDAVSFSGGGTYNVQTGRRDGLVSLASNVDLPPPFISVSDSIASFAAKGLNVTDMVYLLGGHTVGVAHCSSFQHRLYNFNQTGGPDPTMNSVLLTTLRLRCPLNSSVNNTVNLDQGLLSSTVVDKSFYQQILLNKGILQIDQQLALDPLTKPRVTSASTSMDFQTRFGEAMVKMGGIEVLTGTDGEIRSSCQDQQTGSTLVDSTSALKSNMPQEANKFQRDELMINAEHCILKSSNLMKRPISQGSKLPKGREYQSIRQRSADSRNQGYRVEEESLDKIVQVPFFHE